MGHLTENLAKKADETFDHKNVIFVMFLSYQILYQKRVFSLLPQKSPAPPLHVDLRRLFDMLKFFKIFNLKS